MALINWPTQVAGCTNLGDLIDKDCPPPSTSGTRPLASGNGEGNITVGQDTGLAVSNELPLDLGSGFQWQFPDIESDVFGGGPFFNWDQSFDMIAGGLGMDIFQ